MFSSLPCSCTFTGPFVLEMKICRNSFHLYLNLPHSYVRSRWEMPSWGCHKTTTWPVFLLYGDWCAACSFSSPESAAAWWYTLSQEWWNSWNIVLLQPRIFALLRFFSSITLYNVAGSKWMLQEDMDSILLSDFAHTVKREVSKASWKVYAISWKLCRISWKI